MQKYKSNITTTSGAAVRGVPVLVIKEDGSNAALFLDRAGTSPAPNPLTTGPDGVFYFYAVNGRYSLRTTVDGVTITDDDVVLMMDPEEITVAGPIAEAVAAAQAAAIAAEFAVEASGIPDLVAAAQNAVVDANNAVSLSATSANNAAISKTGADSARDDALIAKNAAEAALDSFDDRYLGAKAVAPTTDNNGAALLPGALYWDTVLGAMRAWSGTEWVTLPVATKASVGLANVDNTSDAVKIVASAGKLTTARTINGVFFDGSANISIDAAAVPNTPSGSIAATTVQDAINELAEIKVDLAAATGASLVGYLPAGTGAVATDVQTRLRSVDLKTVNVQDYVTGGLGTSASPWVGWDTEITWASSTQYDFLDGYYSYATSPNFGLTFLKLNGKAGTVIRHTGTGYAMIVDAGAGVSDFAIGVDIKCRLESTALAAGGVLCRGISRSAFDMSFRNIPGVCFREIFGVCNTLRLMKTAFVIGQEVQPISLLSVEKRSVGEETSAGTYYVIAENCSSYGVVLTDCLNGTFIGGTSEANAGGYFIDNASAYNTFIGLDLEINTAADVVCNGSYNTFINCLSTTVVTFGGTGNSIIGGIYDTINSNGINNDFKNVRYSANAGAFLDTGTSTTKSNVLNITTGNKDIDLTADAYSLRTGSGSLSIPDNTATTIFSAAGVGMYQVYAHVTSSDATNFTASAVVMTEAGATTRIIANNTALLFLTVSGTNVQVRQTAGGPTTVQYSFLRIV